MLRDLEHEAHVVALDLERREDRRELALLELDVDDGADDLKWKKGGGGRGWGGGWGGGEEKKTKKKTKKKREVEVERWRKR